MGARALPVLLAITLAGGCNRQAPPAPQQEAQAPAATPRAAPLAIVTANKGKAAPKATFTDLTSGGQTDLSAFRGKPLLVNLWATWCGPCVKELPALDALAAAQAGRLQVVAVSEDMEGTGVVAPFLAKRGVKTLKPYHDPNNALLTELKEASLPVSVLYDAEGKEVWRVPGDLDWSGEKAKALLAEAGI